MTPIEIEYASVERSRFRRVRQHSLRLRVRLLSGTRLPPLRDRGFDGSFNNILPYPLSSMYSRRYDPRHMPTGVCRYWYQGRGCRNLAHGLSCNLQQPGIWRERNLCHRFEDGRNCKPFCLRIHGEQPLFDVHTFLTNKAAEDPTWKRSVVEVARVLAGAPPILAIRDQDSSEFDAKVSAPQRQNYVQPVPG